LNTPLIDAADCANMLMAQQEQEKLTKSELA